MTKIRDSVLVITRDIVVDPKSMPPSIEKKVGSNCAVKLSSNNYMLIFCSVDFIFGTYHIYDAILSEDGELLGVVSKLIISPRPNDYYGARPSTIFICRASLVGDDLILVADKDYEVTLILESDLK